MATACEWKEKLTAGECDRSLAYLYGEDAVASARERYIRAVDGYVAAFGEPHDLHLFSAPGRTEIGGNHTDHNRGRTLAAAVNMDIVAAVEATDGDMVVQSEGYPLDRVSTTALDPVSEETGRSAALIRGLAARFAQNGWGFGGFNAYTVSSVPKGSGLSSSAAYEVLLATVLNALYNGGKLPDVELAKASQFAESAYFGKPCGLLDQTAAAVGGIVALDFADPENPIVTRPAVDFDRFGLTLCVVDAHADHADLTDEYAAIPAEMKAVAAKLGVTYLRETSAEALLDKLAPIRAECGDRAVLRALHFFAEDARVPQQVAALEAGDGAAFLALVKESGHSSFEYLQNVYPSKTPAAQALSLALCLAQRELGESGAWRVHGGGFGGTILCFVPTEQVCDFTEKMERVFGKDSCRPLRIRPVGGAELTADGM
ncbi:MAG: galactokinase [Clostridia bacterium]|nr:galactokinase [Clostridia bacterium]